MELCNRILTVPVSNPLYFGWHVKVDWDKYLVSGLDDVRYLLMLSLKATIDRIIFLKEPMKRFVCICLNNTIKS